MILTMNSCMSIYDGGRSGMSSISKEEVTRVIRSVIAFSEDELPAEEKGLFEPKLKLILNKVIEELIFVSEENLVLLMECRNDMQKYWEALSIDYKRREGMDYKIKELSLDNVISKMKLCVPLEKLKALCV